MGSIFFLLLLSGRYLHTYSLDIHNFNKTLAIFIPAIRQTDTLSYYFLYKSVSFMSHFISFLIILLSQPCV